MFNLPLRRIICCTHLTMFCCSNFVSTSVRRLRPERSLFPVQIDFPFFFFFFVLSISKSQISLFVISVVDTVSVPPNVVWCSCRRFRLKRQAIFLHVISAVPASDPFITGSSLFLLFFSLFHNKPFKMLYCVSSAVFFFSLQLFRALSSSFRKKNTKKKRSQPLNLMT